MSRRVSPKGLLLLTVVAVLATATPAHAYIDPGFGSMLIQALLAVFAGLLFYVYQAKAKLKHYAHALMSKFGGAARRSKDIR